MLGKYVSLNSCSCEVTEVLHGSGGVFVLVQDVRFGISVHEEDALAVHRLQQD